MSKKSKPLNLEDSLGEITKVIEEMEKSNLSLEQSLERFERGITLIKHCQLILQEAEQKVQILMQNNNREEPNNYENLPE